MWTEVIAGLDRIPEAVLTGLDATGAPTSLRCRPRPDDSQRVLRCPRAPGVDLSDGPASMLFHRHDEDLWQLRSFLVRGRLHAADTEWEFVPVTFVPGLGMRGPIGEFRGFVAARRRAARYLARRGLARPTVPWSRVRARP